MCPGSALDEKMSLLGVWSHTKEQETASEARASPALFADRIKRQQRLLLSLYKLTSIENEFATYACSYPNSIFCG